MGSMSILHWLIVLVVVMLLFGAGKLPQVFADLGKGFRAFRKGFEEETKALPGTAADKAEDKDLEKK
jgi:sec-independent protein translocase protein TatA